MTPEQPFDAGNPLLAQTPANMSTALVDTAGGQRMALTIRTASTTLTVLLAQEDARTWGGNISKTADRMSKAGLVIAGPGAAVNGNGKAAP